MFKTYLNSRISSSIGSEAQMQYYSTDSAAILWLFPTLNLNNTIPASLLPVRFLQYLKSLERQSYFNSHCLTLTTRKSWQIPATSLPSFSLPKSQLNTQGHQESTSDNQEKSLQNPFIIEREYKKQRVKLPIVTACQCWNQSSLMSTLKEMSPERAELPLCFLGAVFGLYL